jgi:hypothetical protein
MERRLRFASEEAYIDITQSLASSFLEGYRSSEVIEWAVEVARRVNRLPSGVVFRIGKLRLPLESSRRLAHTIAYSLCESLQRLGTPTDMTVEIDRSQNTSVTTGYQVRTLLPHHDGGHCSYLTPSRKDDPSWTATLRRFSKEEGYTTTQAHKLYQGIFVTDPGEGLSVTPYFDLIPILCRAYTHTTGLPAHSIKQLASWLGKNIRASLALQDQHRSRYLTLGATLGAQKLLYLGVAIHYAEADFKAEEVERFPELNEFRKIGQKQSARPPAESFLNQVLIDTIGLTWEDFREEYEICLPSERYDFVLGHNLVLLHGGLMGGKSRLLEPICMVVNDPVGEEYESWLAQAWQRGAK